MTRWYPLYSGCATISLNPMMRRLSGESSERVWARCPGGKFVLAPLDDYVGRVLYFAGDLDPKLTWVCRSFVRKGDTAVDVGANIGLVTMVLAALVGAEGTVHAFEPNPRIVTLLELTIERNQATNVTLHPVALGEAESMLELIIPSSNTGGASLVRWRSTNSNAERALVPVRRLDEELHDAGPIRLLKIDVEGYEPKVFRGGERLFRDRRPQLVIFEVNHTQGRCADHPSFQVLQEYDYRFLSMPRRFLRVSVQRLELTRPIREAGHDFLAVPAEHYDQTCAMLRAC